MRACLLTALGVLYLLPAYGQTPEPNWNAALTQLDALVKVEADKLHGPSFSVAVVSRRHPAYFVSYGYADLAHKTAATPHTIYEIGSITKVFTGTMLMQLRDAGKASLDDPITKHLPEFRVVSPFGGLARPTLRQLISHTSGLPRMSPQFSELEGGAGSDAQAIAALHGTAAVMPPFTRFKYSNLGVAITGYALARTAKTPWSVYIDRKILHPLGMSESSAARARLPAAQIAAGYLPGEDSAWSVGTPMPFSPVTEAAASMLSTTTDLAKFAAWQLDETDTRVLSAVSRREMRAPLWMNDDWTGGSGVAWALDRRDGEVLVNHGGGTSGFSSMLCLVPKQGIAIVVLGNSMADAQGLAFRLLTPLIAAAKAEQASIEAALPAEPLPQNAERFAGAYAHDAGLLPPVTVSVKAGTLVMHDDAWGTIELKPTSDPRTFTVTGNYPLDNEAVTFEGDGADARLLVGHGSIVYKRTP